MTELLERAVAVLREMPEETQDDVARALLGMANAMSLDDIEPDHRDAVREGLEQAARGEFATDEEVAAIFRRFGR